MAEDSRTVSLKIAGSNRLTEEFGKEAVSESITMDLMGGLGNQMFQYAAGKALALRTGASLLLNTRPFSADQKRAYALGVFALPERCVDIPIPRIHRWQRALNRIYPINFNRTMVREPHFHYWEEFTELRAGVHLNGYWASPRYFAGYEEHIRRAFAFPKPSSSIVSGIEAKMRNVHSVSVHLRQGDYLTQEVAKFHGNLGAEYYLRAGEVMRRMAPQCCFFVFSDDITAARAFFSGWENVEFVETGSQYDDLYLMSCCKHHIIANSTYSWWGAWLAGNDSGIVIAPRYWFSRETMLHKYVLDLISEKWIIV